MKLVAVLGAASAVMTAAAYAGEMTDACVARLEAEGRDTSGCGCLEEHIGSDAALEDEFRSLAEIDDPAERYGAASDAAKAAMDACTRK
ncbi:MAG: hypothetical protein R3C58_06415 [Parvularculaceae bacterium]